MVINFYTRTGIQNGLTLCIGNVPVLIFSKNTGTGKARNKIFKYETFSFYNFRSQEPAIHFNLPEHTGTVQGHSNEIVCTAIPSNYRYG
jgi:hypothetical protein